MGIVYFIVAVVLVALVFGASRRKTSLNVDARPSDAHGEKDDDPAS